MQRRKFFLLAAGSVAALAAGALADPPHDHDDHGHGPGPHPGPGGHNDWNGHSHRDWRDERGAWHNDHDRYWRPDFGGRGFANRDRIFFNLRRRRYTRFVGDPYWFQGRYVVRTYDPYGRLVFVEINPYTGDFVGVVAF